MIKRFAVAALSLGTVATALALSACSGGEPSSSSSPQPSGITADHPWYALVSIIRWDAAEPTSADQQAAMASLSSRLASNGPEGAYVFATPGGLDITVAFLEEPSDAVQASLEAPLSVDFRPVWASGDATDTELPGSLPEAAGDQDAALAADWTSLDCTDPGDGTGASYGDGPAHPLVVCARDGLTKYVLGPVELDGRSLATASASPIADPAGGTTGEWAVLLTFTPSGTSAFGAFTTRLAASAPPQNTLAILLDGFVVSAPAVTFSIPGGEAQVPGGNLDEAAATALARDLQQATFGLTLRVSVIEELAASTP
jgi:hypothetical protein